MRSILFAAVLSLPVATLAAPPLYLADFVAANPGDAQQRERAGQLGTALQRALAARQVQVLHLDDRQPLPQSGWLIQGQVASQGGRRLVRTAVGFGAGASSVEAQVWISDLAAGEWRQLAAQDRSGRLPGALLTRNPQVAAAKFLLERRALDRNLDDVAAELADEIVRDLAKAR
ncbi:DUF4410 domain-containing protein [Pseudomonas sp. ENNP23]|uniref:DUF4410 domain-containing protein n=1 Tax=Pseudomonas sp. ENNP23 TaxID=1535636 RepID=UPI00084AF298|nr:DUF4410 domain-containing protein [Pseudomonas sp. ENNP23]OEC59895.1 hypothetical protein A9G05_09130 [Pseudomonas sp. ENNP23]